MDVCKGLNDYRGGRCCPQGGEQDGQDLEARQQRETGLEEEDIEDESEEEGVSVVSSSMLTL